MQTSFISNAELSDGKALAADVIAAGWVKRSIQSANYDLLETADTFAKLLGNAVPGRNGHRVERLMPIESAGAYAKSLSAAHGLGSFPMHTDGAHRVQPPRFVVLLCASPGIVPMPTLLTRFGDLRITPSEYVRFETAPFLVRNGRRSFYSTICSRSRMFIRFDEGCMVPQSLDAEASARLITRRAREVGGTAVNWETGDILVIDNWNVLHGRGVGDANVSSDRKLFRVSVQ